MQTNNKLRKSESPTRKNVIKQDKHKFEVYEMEGCVCSNAVSDIPSEMRTKCQRFSRVVGYYAPISQWNEGKQAEWKDRKMFNIK